MAAAEKKGRAIRYIRLERVMDVSANNLADFIQETLEPGVTIHTDVWKSCAGLPAAGYTHRIAVINGGMLLTVQI